MKRKLKSFAALAAAALMVFSAVGTAAADTAEQTKWVVLERTGADTDGVTGYYNWNQHSTTTTYVTSKNAESREVYYIGVDTPPVGKKTASTDGLTEMDAERFRLIPLVSSGSTLSKKAFSEHVADFADANITVDVAKGSSYWANVSKFSAFKIGLAYVDFNAENKPTYTYSSGTVSVYPTDIAWLDITESVTALPSYNLTSSWYTAKTNVSVSVKNIIASTDHKYIHGATAETCSVTAENANAIVFGIVMSTGNETAVISSSNVLQYDNLCIEMPDAEFALSGSASDGVTLTATNPTKAAITPTVITAYYKGNSLVAAVPDKAFTISAGAVNSTKTYTISDSYDYDKVKVIVIDGYDTLTPLCENFEE